MIEDKIEIMIPTYNRAKYLDRTLNSLLNSPFKNCKITVRDNASPDDTPLICEKYADKFENITIIRNNKNIGGDGNIIRSYETATKEYVWVLADNDLLNFDDCKDFIEAIESEKYGLIICSSGNFLFEETPHPTFETKGLSEYIKENSDKSNHLENTAEELVSIIKQYYFSVTSFIPSAIYKTELIDSDYLIKGYEYISRKYPHFPLLVKALEENVLTYKTKKDIVLIQDNPDEWDVGALEFYSKRLDVALIVKDKKFREYASRDPKGGIIYQTLAYYVVGKVKNQENLRSQMTDLIIVVYKLKGLLKGTFYAILFLLFLLIPRKICEIVYNKRFGQL